METTVQPGGGVLPTIGRVYARKGVFSLLTLLIFLGSVGTLARYDLLPEPRPMKVAATPPGGVETPQEERVEAPEKISIPEIGLSADITNPTTIDIASLDRALLSGAVRYPTSAKLGEAGNVVLFGHSSYLPVVLNPAFKTFNGIQKLEEGDIITVYSSSMAYTYRVKSVTKESADEAGIPLAVSGKQLTLATCDSFGKKSDRFVVVSDFVESRPLGV